MMHLKINLILGYLVLSTMGSLIARESHALPKITCLDYSNNLSADFSEWNLIPDSPSSTHLNETYSLQHIYSGLTYIHERPIRSESIVTKGLQCEFSNDSLSFTCSNKSVRATLEGEEGKDTYVLKIDKTRPDLDISSRFIENLECSQ